MEMCTKRINQISPFPLSRKSYVCWAALAILALVTLGTRGCSQMLEISIYWSGVEFSSARREIIKLGFFPAFLRSSWCSVGRIQGPRGVCASRVNLDLPSHHFQGSTIRLNGDNTCAAYLLLNTLCMYVLCYQESKKKPCPSKCLYYLCSDNTMCRLVCERSYFQYHGVFLVCVCANWMLFTNPLFLLPTPTHISLNPAIALEPWMALTRTMHITHTHTHADMAQGLFQMRDVQHQAHHEDVQGIQQDALLQRVSLLLDSSKLLYLDSSKLLYVSLWLDSSKLLYVIAFSTQLFLILGASFAHLSIHLHSVATK